MSSTRASISNLLTSSLKTCKPPANHFNLCLQLKIIGLILTTPLGVVWDLRTKSQKLSATETHKWCRMWAWKTSLTCSLQTIKNWIPSIQTTSKQDHQLPTSEKMNILSTKISTRMTSPLCSRAPNSKITLLSQRTYRQKTRLSILLIPRRSSWAKWTSPLGVLTSKKII